MVAALRGSIPLAVIVALGACEPPWHPLPQWEETEGSTSERKRGPETMRKSRTLMPRSSPAEVS